MNSIERIERLKTVGIILRPETPELASYVEDFLRFLKNYEINAILDAKSAAMIGHKGEPFNRMCEGADFLISIGGDGTLISTIRRSYAYRLPVLGVNMGNLGFLTDFRADQIKLAIEKIFQDDYRVDVRMMMQVDAFFLGHKTRYFAINDLVIRGKGSKMSRINLHVDGHLANRYHGDALIVSTPTGATGYNLSAGGPLVFPYAKNFIFTPICAHSLTQRPLVLPVNFDIRLSVETEECVVVIDGQDEFDFEPGEELVLSMADNGAKMIHRKERNFFQIVSEKLRWGD